jgi:hypothetical protein
MGATVLARAVATGRPTRRPFAVATAGVRGATRVSTQRNQMRAVLITLERYSELEQRAA